MPAQNTSAAPTPAGLTQVVSGTQNSTSSGSPAIAGRCRRTASTSVKTPTRPIPATVSSTTPGEAGTGGADLEVSAVAWATSTPRRCTDDPVGTSPAHDWRWANNALRYNNSPATAASQHTPTEIARRRVAPPTASATIT